MRFVAEFGEGAPLTAANVARAKARGMNLVWFFVRLADAALLAEFVAFTMTQRKAAVDVLLGRGAPADARSLKALAAVAHEDWAETGDVATRGRARALREAARDGALTEVGPVEAEEAAVAAQRAISYAGLDQAAAAEAQQDWLAARLGVA